MKEYLYTLLIEKGYELDEFIEVDYDDLFGPVIMQLIEIVNFILQQDKNIQTTVRKTLVKIDFMNGDVMDYFKYIGKGIYSVSVQ